MMTITKTVLLVALLLSACAPVTGKNVPSGSSDVDMARPGAAFTPEYIFQHQLYGAGGVAG
jgi:hypothetical protein